MERVDCFGDGPSPREPVRLQQCVPAVPGDVHGHPMEQPDLRIFAVLELAQVPVPDTFSASAVTHSRRLLASLADHRWLAPSPRSIT
jgi:hypothetical protein